MTNIDIEELRELAEDAIVRNDRWILGRGDGIEQSQAAALARGILSALDALDTANKKVTCGGVNCGECLDCLKVNFYFAKYALDSIKKELDEQVLVTDQIAAQSKEHLDALEAEKRAADVERLVAERDRLAALLQRVADTSYTTGIETKLLADIESALAGVPGGSPEEEEHNPGTTAAQSSVVRGIEADRQIVLADQVIEVLRGETVSLKAEADCYYNGLRAVRMSTNLPEAHLVARSAMNALNTRDRACGRDQDSTVGGLVGEQSDE